MDPADIAVEHGPSIPYLREVLVFLLASVLVVPFFRRLKASPVIGYLFVGVIVGPYGLGIVSDVGGVRRLAELGVVFLLFTVGLELSFDRLAAMRRDVFGLGLAQVALSGLIIGIIAWGWGNTIEASIVLGACLALSSTAIVMQLLVERGEIGTRLGRVSFAILLFQDLAVVPLIVLAGAFADPSTSIGASLGIAFGKAIAAIVVIVILGRLILRRLYRMVGRAGSTELFMATTLLVILGIALGTGLMGLSMAMGAFLAGLLLAETEFRHQVDVDIQPFRGLLLGLFFISVGMGIDIIAIADQVVLVLLSVAGLVGIKAVTIAVLVLAFGHPREVAIRAALLLGAGGEFALIVVGIAMTEGVIPEAVGYFMLLVAVLSMATTPFMPVLGVKIVDLLFRREEAQRLDEMEADVEGISGHVVIAGYGRVGQTIARLLDAQKIPYIGLDVDVGVVRDCRQRRIPVYFGDASRPEVLDRLHVDRAIAIVVTMDRPDAARRAVSGIRRHWPKIQIFARARDATHAKELEDLGADEVVPEALEASLVLAGQALRAGGTPIEACNILIDRIREEHYRGLDSSPDREQKRAAE